VSSLSNIPEEVVREILSKSAGSSKPIFFPIQEYNTSVPSCLYTIAEIPDVTLSAWEIGILLSDSLRGVESWPDYLKRLQIPGLRLLAPESQGVSQGGTAAGNLLWLLQSLGRTYSRTRELVKVCERL